MNTSMRSSSLSYESGTLFSAKAWAGITAVAALFAALPALNLIVPPGHSLYVSSFTIALIGKFMCYAMAALALDLVWGYAGILSLGHGLFFALGGYGMGMYLMRSGKPTPDIVPDFMTFLSWKTV